MGLREIRERIRKWVDGQESDDPLVNISNSAKQRRDAEEFIAQVAKEIDSAMQKEMFSTPKGVVNIPPQFFVFMSSQLDKQWKSSTKRQALKQALSEITAERAIEMRGDASGDNPSVDLRIDGTLKANQFRVQAMWDDEGDDTIFVPEEIEETVLDPSLGAEEIYAIEIWHSGIRQENFSATKELITIGRGSREQPADLAIKGDPNVSRIHAELRVSGKNQFSLTAKGLNPTIVNGKRRDKDAPVRVMPGEKIKIGSYTLAIKAKAGGKTRKPNTIAKRRSAKSGKQGAKKRRG